MITNSEMVKLMLQEQERAQKNDNKYKKEKTNEYEELCKMKEEGYIKARKESTELYELKKSLLSDKSNNTEYDEYCKIKEEGYKKTKKEFTELYNLKKSLLSECIYTIFDKALGFQLESQEKDNMKRALVNNFIEEQGLDRLLGDFRTKSYLLSEFSRIVNETVKSVYKKCKEEECSDINIDDELRSDFYEQIDMDDANEIAAIIKKRTSMAVEEFIQANMNDRLEIKNIFCEKREYKRSI